MKVKNMWESVVAVVITVVSGVLVFLLGEIINEIWLKLLQKYKEIKQTIAFDLVYYADCSFNGCQQNYTPEFIKKGEDASNKYRSDAATLSGFIESLSWLKLFIPNKKKLREASRALIGLSNSIFANDSDRIIHMYSDEVSSNLKLNR